MISSVRNERKEDLEDGVAVIKKQVWQYKYEYKKIIITLGQNILYSKRYLEHISTFTSS